LKIAYCLIEKIEMQSLILKHKRPVDFACQHEQVHEIGEDFDQDGKMMRLVRCITCGLLIREYVHTI